MENNTLQQQNKYLLWRKFKMTNEKRIDNCVTDLIETITKNITNMYGKGSTKQSDEIAALASLITARATIISHKDYSSSDSGISKE